MAKEPKREILTDAKRELIEKARTTLQVKIDRLNEAGWHNQFDYANYGVQYNPIYDKKTGRVKSFAESGLSSPKTYLHLAKMMGSAPELTIKWNRERAERIGARVFATLSHNDVFTGFPDRESFIKAYVEAVRKYHEDDEDFNYEVIKSMYESVGGVHIAGARHDWSDTDATDYYSM